MARRITPLSHLAISLGPASVRAIFDLIPNLGPLLAPDEWALADQASLHRQIAFLDALGHAEHLVRFSKDASKPTATRCARGRRI